MAETATNTVPEQQIPNYPERARAIEEKVRGLFAASLEAGRLACLRSGVASLGKRFCYEPSSRTPYFDIGTVIDPAKGAESGSLYRHYLSTVEIDDGGLHEAAMLATYWPKTHRQNRRKPVRAWGNPAFPPEISPGDLVRGIKARPRIHPVNYLRDNRAIYIASPDTAEDPRLGWVSDDTARGLYVSTEHFFHRTPEEVTAKLERIEALLGAVALPGGVTTESDTTG